MIHACTNKIRLTSGEVFNYCINWSKASFEISIVDIQEQNNVLQICWLCCNDISKHLGWYAKRGALIIWFWAKSICLDALLFRKSLHKELHFFIQVIDSRSFIGAKTFRFLFICQWFSSMSNSFHRKRLCRLHNGFGLITLLSFILLISFVAISDSIDGGQSVYLPVKVTKRMSLKQSTFYDVENSTPLVGLEPTISRLHTELHL